MMKKLLYPALALLIPTLSMANPIEKIGSKGAELERKIIAQLQDITIYHGGFGSDAFKDPKNQNRFYAITDRGPNADGPNNNSKVFPVPDFVPSIGHFEIQPSGKIRTLSIFPMRRPNGQLLTGLPNPKGMGSTGETALDLPGNVLEPDAYGIDSEGLVVDDKGDFWISDEYGPHIVHFNSKGIEQERISPIGVESQGRKLPAVLAKRTPNRGMEGLTITPDGQTLVGIMQSTLSNPSKAEVVNKTLTRIVSFDLKTGATKQYLYRQNGNNFSNSAIIALDKHRFLINERDGLFPDRDKNAQKQVYLIDLKDATEVSGDIHASSGLLVNGKTLEQNSWEELAQAGITPATKTLMIDMVKQYQYPHEKFEGMWLIDRSHLAVINDDDFGIINEDGKLVNKVLPATGKIDANTVYVYPISLPQ